MRILIKVIIGINILSFSSAIFLISKSDLVYLRQLLTGKFIADTLNIDLNESTLNNEIENLFTYGDKSLIKTIFDQNKKNKLDSIKKLSTSSNCRVPSDHPQTKLTKTDCLARLIAYEVSPYFTGKKCGLSGSISKKIKNVGNGIGCCSDFNQSFMLQAGYLGLKVREVSNVNHTAAEYFDPFRNEWKWIDTSYRMQISNDDGQILSAFKIYKKGIGEPLHLINTFPIYRGKTVPYNRTADMGEISYTLYDDIVEKEKLKNRLVKIGFPSLMANFIQLNSQNLFRPKYLVLGGGLRSVGINANLLQKILFINIFNSLLTLISLLLLFKVKKS